VRVVVLVGMVMLMRHNGASKKRKKSRGIFELTDIGIFAPENYVCTPFFKTRDDSVAQLVEQMTLNHWVVGSTPTGITVKRVLAYS
jgi:hypothetical protein